MITSSIHGIINPILEARMAVVVEILVPHASRAQHDQLDASMEAAMGQQGGPPTGLMVHFARPAVEGFLLCEVWRTEADMRPFFDDVVLPTMVDVGLRPEEPSVTPVWGFARPPGT